MAHTKHHSIHVVSQVSNRVNGLLLIPIDMQFPKVGDLLDLLTYPSSYHQWVIDEMQCLSPDYVDQKRYRIFVSESNTKSEINIKTLPVDQKGTPFQPDWWNLPVNSKIWEIPYLR